VSASTLPRLAAAIAVSIALNAAAAEAPLAQPIYYPTRELDVQPGIKTRVQPEYPVVAARRGISGKVVLRLYINEKGGVDRVEILHAEPRGVFESSAERAFRAARFSPGMKSKRPVKTKMTIEVSFDSPAPAPGAGWR
jgi:TonB family protein